MRLASAMDSASAFGAEGSGFESQVDRSFFKYILSYKQAIYCYIFSPNTTKRWQFNLVYCVRGEGV